MGLNIKNEHVCELARRAAGRTGRNRTSVIELALQRLLDDLDQAEATTARLELIHAMQTTAEHVDLEPADLYDEHGLPR